MFYGTNNQYYQDPKKQQQQLANTVEAAASQASFGVGITGQPTPAVSAPAPTPAPQTSQAAFGGSAVNAPTTPAPAPAPSQAAFGGTPTVENNFIAKYIQEKTTPGETQTPDQATNPDGSFTLFNGAKRYPDGRIVHPDGKVEYDSVLQTQDGVSQPPDMDQFLRGLDWSPQNAAIATKSMTEAMAKYGWSADQVGQNLGFTGQQIQDHIARQGAGKPTLSQGAIDFFKPSTSGSGYDPSNGQAYFDPATGKSYTKTGGSYINPETGQQESSQPLQIIEFDPRTQKPGDVLNVYNPDGTFSHTFKSSKDEGTKLLLMAMAAAGGMMMLPGGAFAQGAGAGTTAATTAGETAAGTGVTVGGPMSTGLPAMSALPPAAATAPAAASTGLISGAKAAITSALTSVGLSAKDAAAIATVLAASQGKDPPAYPSGTSSSSGSSTGATTGSSQGKEARAFLDEVLPAVRTNSSNPYGSAKWTKDANGQWTLDTRLNAGNQGIYDSATGKLDKFLTEFDPSQKAPALIDDAGGKYSKDLAQTIYDRTMGMQATGISEERRAQQARLAEQGFVPGSEGYEREMTRWEEKLGEMRNKASMDSQIQAAQQALAEAGFTNSSRTQSFQNTQQLQAQIAQILAGARNNATGGLKDLTTQASAPTGSPGNVQSATDARYASDLANYQSDAQRRNDMVNSILRLFL